MQELNPFFSTDLLSEESNPFKPLVDVTVGDVVFAKADGRYFVIKVSGVYFMKSEILDDAGDVISSKNNFKGLRFESENDCSPFGCHISHIDDNEDFFSFPEFELQNNTYFFEASREGGIETKVCEVCIDRRSDSFKYDYAIFYFGKGAIKEYNAQIKCNQKRKDLRKEN